MTQDELMNKIEEERKALDEMVLRINQEIAFRKGRIDMLTELLKAVTPELAGEPDDRLDGGDG